MHPLAWLTRALLRRAGGWAGEVVEVTARGAAGTASRGRAGRTGVVMLLSLFGTGTLCGSGPGALARVAE